MEKISLSYRFPIPYSLLSRSWFTLIELIVSITILSVIMLSVFSIYSNLIQINRKLEAVRIVQENIRNITEQIASDVREKWIDFDYYDGSPGHETNNYTGRGNAILAIRSGEKYYVMKDGIDKPTICDEIDQKDPNIHCYLGKEDTLGKRIPISDDRVRMEDVRFFLSGDASQSVTNTSQEWKATILLSLGIEKKMGFSSEISNNANMRVQTTISEKVYKK